MNCYTAQEVKWSPGKGLELITGLALRKGRVGIGSGAPCNAAAGKVMVCFGGLPNSSHGSALLSVLSHGLSGSSASALGAPMQCGAQELQGLCSTSQMTKGIELKWLAKSITPSLHFRNGVYEGRAGDAAVGGVQFGDGNASNAVQWLEVESWLCVMELQFVGGSGEHWHPGLPRTLGDTFSETHDFPICGVIQSLLELEACRLSCVCAIGTKVLQFNTHLTGWTNASTVREFI